MQRYSNILESLDRRLEDGKEPPVELGFSLWFRRKVKLNPERCLYLAKSFTEVVQYHKVSPAKIW